MAINLEEFEVIEPYIHFIPKDFNPNKLGRVCITHTHRKEFRQILYAFAKEVTILRTSENYVNDMVEFYCIHPEFREVQEGYMIPKYRAIMKEVKSEDGQEMVGYSFEFEDIKDE